MRIYNYDGTNGRYLGESVADANPLEPGEYLIPAHATVDPPPEQEGMVAVFRGAWTLEPEAPA